MKEYKLTTTMIMNVCKWYVEFTTSTDVRAEETFLQYVARKLRKYEVLK